MAHRFEVAADGDVHLHAGNAEGSHRDHLCGTGNRTRSCRHALRNIEHSGARRDAVLQHFGRLINARAARQRQSRDRLLNISNGARLVPSPPSPAPAADFRRLADGQHPQSDTFRWKTRCCSTLSSITRNARSPLPRTTTARAGCCRASAESAHRHETFDRSIMTGWANSGCSAARSGATAARACSRRLRPDRPRDRARRLGLPLGGERAVLAGHAPDPRLRQRGAAAQVPAEARHRRWLGCFGLTEPDPAPTPAAW